MSNKIQLQANNTKVASLIEVLQSKAIPSGEDVTTETNTYTTKLASLESAVTALENELASKASGGSGTNVGIQYEIITIPAGATSATYTLPRVTNAFGSYNEYLCDYEFDKYDFVESTGVILSIQDALCTMIEGWNNTTIMSEALLVSYNKGTITWERSAPIGTGRSSFNLLLINDPSKEVLFTCTPSE